MIQIYTDGACSKRNGGWAFYVPETRHAEAQYAPDTTNQRMELYAALQALDWAYICNYKEVEIVSDSKYLTECFNQRWWVKWLKNDWKNSTGKPVANQDIWEPLIELAKTMTVTWTWVKGHSGNEFNEHVDMLAQSARELNWT